MEPELAEFIDLFDREQFWESHEVLEALWRRCPAERRDLYQGLIQAAAALVHWQRGNRHGMDTLEARARRRLAAYGPAAEGIDLARLLAELAACLHEGGPPPRFGAAGASVSRPRGGPARGPGPTAEDTPPSDGCAPP